MPKCRPGPFSLVPAPLSGSREQIREQRASQASVQQGMQQLHEGFEACPTLLGRPRSERWTAMTWDLVRRV